MNIGGKERPIKFGVNQTDLFCELRGIKLNDYYKLLGEFEGGEYLFKDVRDLLWSALKDGARQAKIEFNEEPLTIGDWMDIDPAGIISEVMRELVGSLPKPVENGTTKKKKVTKV